MVSLAKPKHVYLDVCALCRPFDDQSQMRIRLETEAVQLILSHVRSKTLNLWISPVHTAEIAAIEDFAAREHLLTLLRQIGQIVTVDLSYTRQRAEALTVRGLGVADAAHLAFAEAANAAFVSCDDRLLRQCKRVGVTVWYGTPIAFCDKEKLQ